MGEEEKNIGIKPLQDRVVVQRVEEETKSDAGYIIPETAREKPLEGEVVAIGDGKVLDSGTVIKLSVKVGDRVLFGQYSGSEIKIEDNEYLMLREDDIFGIITL